MGGIRVRWRGVGKLGALVAAAVVALTVAPALLAPPQAPPLAPDVGLPRVVEAAPVEPPAEPRAVVIHEPEPKQQLKRRPRVDFRSHTERKSTRPAPAPAPPPPPPPAPEPVAPAPVPAAPTPQPAPEDGSMEFAPH